jgi:DNA-binding SARP family transcriptional activator
LQGDNFTVGRESSRGQFAVDLAGGVTQSRAVRIEVLGPVVVAGQVDVQQRDRSVLAALVVRSPLTTGALAEALWGDEPPTSYRKVIQGSIVRLRRRLGQDAILTIPAGYVLNVPDDEIDVGRFDADVSRARAMLAKGEPADATEALRTALSLWRGEPFAEVADWDVAVAEVARLGALRESAEDLLVEATLAAGRPEEAVELAEPLATAAPYREPRWALWARALYASGRQAEALDVITRLRKTLDDDLGIDLAPEVADLETAILRQDPSLDVRRVPSARPYRPRVLAAAGAAMILAAVAIGIALLQRDRAYEAGAAAEAIRLGEVAEAQEDPAVGLALAAESMATADSPTTRASALQTFGNFADLLSTGVAPDAPWPADAPVVTSPDGRTTATAHSAAIQLAVDDHPTHRLATPTDLPTALAFSADGRYLAAGMSELGFPLTGSTIVWNVETGTEVARFDSGEGAVQAHVWAPDGSSVWSLGDDGIHHWDLTRSHALARTGDGDPVMFRAGETVLAIGDRSTKPWIDYACALAGRPLTPVEWREYVDDRPYAPTCR